MRTISTEQFVRNIKAGRISSVLPMIAEKARATWHNLPKSEQMVRSLQDLMQEGINFTVTQAAYTFNHRYGVKFTTFLYTALDNFYTDIIRSLYRDKRLVPRGMFSLDSTKVKQLSGNTISLADRMKLTERTKGDSEMLIINRIDAERMFIKAYANASPLLRRYLIRWLIQPKMSKFKSGADFNTARHEFRKVARPLLNPELCEVIQKDYICRHAIANGVMRRFYTPKKKSGRYIHTEEFSLAGIVDQASLLQRIPVIG